MDLIFKCPKCGQELAVDASGAGAEIDCPACNQPILIPEADPSAEAEAPPPEGAPPAGGWSTHVAPVIASSAAAKIKMHLTVPVHETPGETLIAKPLAPLEVAAKESDRKMRVKCIRHIDCVEVGHDRFDETVTNFLEKIGEQNFISISTISYTIIDISTQKLLTDFGVMIVYRG